MNLIQDHSSPVMLFKLLQIFQHLVFGGIDHFYGLRTHALDTICVATDLHSKNGPRRLIFIIKSHSSVDISINGVFLKIPAQFTRKSITLNSVNVFSTALFIATSSAASMSRIIIDLEYSFIISWVSCNPFLSKSIKQSP